LAAFYLIGKMHRRSIAIQETESAMSVFIVSFGTKWSKLLSAYSYENQTQWWCSSRYSTLFFVVVAGLTFFDRR